VEIIKSIIQLNSERCFLCGGIATEWHHIFGGFNRNNSEKYGLKVKLCHNCHNEPPQGAHHNKRVRKMLEIIGQEAFEQAYPALNFLQIFGRNYK